jgi:3-isopropylmalate dehydrogenase
MKLNIAVLPGDGIGPEIIEQALNVVKAVAKKNNHELTYKFGLTGACAIDQVGNPYPDETHELCMQSDAVLFGAIGDPKFDNNPKATVRPEQGLLAMRKKLGLYANIRLLKHLARCCTSRHCVANWWKVPTLWPFVNLPVVFTSAKRS